MKNKQKPMNSNSYSRKFANKINSRAKFNNKQKQIPEKDFKQKKHKKMMMMIRRG